MRTDEEVETILDKVQDSKELDELFGMSFKEGVDYALRWVLEEVSDEELLNLE